MFFICVSRYPFWCASVLCRIYCFLRIGVDGSLSRRSLLFTTLSAVHIYDFHIVTVIYSPLHWLSGTKIPYRPEFCFCLCCWQKFCMQIIFGFKAEVCNLTMVFVLVICLLNWKTIFWIWHRLKGTNLHSLWPLFPKKWWIHECLTKENLPWKLLTDDEVLMPILWYRKLSEL